MTTGAAAFVASAVAMALASRRPSTPVGVATAALLTSVTDAGLPSATRRSSGVIAAASSAGCERSQAARWKRLLLSRGLAARPTPSTVNPRASITAASASPRPRETPVTIAACIPSSGRETAEIRLRVRVENTRTRRELHGQRDPNDSAIHATITIASTSSAIFHGLFGYSPRIVPVTPFIAHWNTRAPYV